MKVSDSYNAFGSSWMKNNQKQGSNSVILVVDDDREMRRHICSILDKNDFNTVEAEDGLAAIKIVDQHRFDLVLLDVVMDKMDGFKVCQYLKAKQDFYSPIIFISTRSNAQDILMGFNLGADDYITKPFKEEELLARIQVGLRLKSYQDTLRSSRLELEDSYRDLERSKIALEKKVIELRTMFETFSTIHSTLNATKIAHGAVLSMMGHQGVSFAMVMYRDLEKGGFLVPLYHLGMEGFPAHDFWFKAEDHFLHWLTGKQRMVRFSEVPEQYLQEHNLVVLNRFHPELIFPMCYQDDLHGLLIMGQKVTGKPFSSDDIEFLELMTLEMSGALRKAAFYLDLKKKSEELQTVYVDTLSVLSNAIEARDKYTVGHTWRVCRFAQALARELGWEEDRVQQIEIGGLLHDIGKIGVDDAILRKNGPLTDDEYQKMKEHPELGVKILSNIDFLKPYLPYILFHQERYDGRGYPMALKGKEIPPEGRLMAICDSFDAMTSDRPYRKGLDPEKAISEIERFAGQQFDPEMAKTFVTIYRQGKLAPYMQKLHKSASAKVCPYCQTSLDPEDLLLKGTDYICPICKHKLDVVP